MPVLNHLSRWLELYTVVLHRARMVALLKAVQALLAGGKLSLTHLGRHRSGTAHVKHHIKSMDRLLGNRHLHRERKGLYRAIAAKLLRRDSRPVLLVDWSDFELERKWLMLKAAVPVGGRAVTVYEQVFPFRRYNSPGAHREFLEALSSVLPAGCRPIVVTDAGFRGPWFRAVEALGWDWIGRIRNGIKYYNESTQRWCRTDSLYARAVPKTQHLGLVVLSRRKHYLSRLYLVRAYQPRRGRPRKRVCKKQGNSTLYRKLHRAPWLLATSLPHRRHSCRTIKKLYSERMQIEQTFRDVKNHRWGLSLRYAASRDGRRLEVLLLIAALATFALWLLGLQARRSGSARHYQANTEHRRPVLSLVFLGMQLLRRLQRPPPYSELLAAASALRQLVNRPVTV